MFKKLLLVILIFYFNASLFAQIHMSVPLGHPVYLIIEQAQMRGLCGFLPAAKPYSRSQILTIIDNILNNEKERRFGRLTDAERIILEQYKEDFTFTADKLNWVRGTYTFEETRKKVYFSGQFAIGADITLAGSYFQTAGGYQYDENDMDANLFSKANHPSSGDLYGDYAIMPSISFSGNLGKNTSYGLTLYGFIGKSPRSILGKYYFDIVNYNNPELDDDYFLRYVYSEPLAYFPYTYKKRWDGFLFAIGDYSSSSQISWPVGLSVGYHMIPEIAADLFGGSVFLRFARIDREWVGMTTNGSVVLNQSAQPFLAIETVIMPFKWIALSSLTGVLEFDTAYGATPEASLKVNSSVFQNAFSIVMLEAFIKSYFSFGIGSSVVWPKRFELGYASPVVENFMYQNNIGDYDNVMLFANAQLQYPGIGRLWFSLSLDEVNMAQIRSMFSMDRMMYIYQIGGSFQIPWVSFTSLSVSYTKNEPYNYTHPRIGTPWNRSDNMEQNYVTFGKSLGHYIPPNSDELMIRLEMIPVLNCMLRLQYQLIRHGAEYGNRAVDGSSLYSELNGDRTDDLELRKSFLRDGAYQWTHIFKLRGEYSLASLKVPAKLFAEVGGVYSYFTDIDGEANSGTRGTYGVINTPQYPRSLSFIGIIGIQLFPKY